MGPGPAPWPFGGALGRRRAGAEPLALWRRWGAAPASPARSPPTPAFGRATVYVYMSGAGGKTKKRPGGPAAGGPAAGGPVARRPGSPAAGRTRLSDTPVRHTHPTYIFFSNCHCHYHH